MSERERTALWVDENFWTDLRTTGTAEIYFERERSRMSRVTIRAMSGRTPCPNSEYGNHDGLLPCAHPKCTPQLGTYLIVPSTDCVHVERYQRTRHDFETGETTWTWEDAP